MTADSHKNLTRALLRILRPLARLLLRNGISFAEFAEYAKCAYVETALTDFSIQGRKPTVSRAAVVTGLTRKEVKRLMDGQDDASGEVQHAYNRAARVVTGWVRDQAFQDREGNPAELTVDGAGSGDFPALVRAYSGDMPARAVLDELVRVDVVEETLDGRVRLLKRAYVPAGDDAQQLHIFGTNVADLISTIDHNLSGSDERPLFQRTVSYDNVPPEVMEIWRKQASEQSQRLLEDLDRLLAAYDRDTAGGAPGAGRIRTGVGVFYFEEDVSDEHPQVRKPK